VCGGRVVLKTVVLFCATVIIHSLSLSQMAWVLYTILLLSLGAFRDSDEELAMLCQDWVQVKDQLSIKKVT